MIEIYPDEELVWTPFEQCVDLMVEVYPPDHFGCAGPLDGGLCMCMAVQSSLSMEMIATGSPDVVWDLMNSMRLCKLLTRTKFIAT